VVELRGLELRAKHAVAIEPVSRERSVNFGRQGRPEILPGRLHHRGGVLCGAAPSRRRSSQCASGRFASNLGTITPHRPLRRKAEDRIPAGTIRLAGQRQQYVQGQPTHRCGGIELLSDRDERHIVLVEKFDQFGKVG
jgi:hypothetical protein